MDNTILGTFEGIDIPGLEAGSTRMAYMVMDASHQGLDESFAAHSGTKYLANMYNDIKGRVDDWAISPELTGENQAVTFWAKSYGSEIKERMEIYYSTGSLNPADFVNLDLTTTVPNEWAQYTVVLPAGAKYFAIRNYTFGGYFLMLDDFKFKAADPAANLSLQGFNVYHNGVKANEELHGECEFVHVPAVHGVQKYVVTAVYDKGESRPCQEAVIQFSGVADGTVATVKVTGLDGEICITGANGIQTVITAMDGKTMYSGIGNDKFGVSVPTGVYVVKVGTKSAKIIVR